MDTRQNSLHLWDDGFLYITPAIRSGLTARSSATVLASVGGQPFTLEAADGTRTRCSAAVVAPHVARRLAVEQGGLLSLNLEPASPSYAALSRYMGGSGIRPIDARAFGRLRDSFLPAQCGALGPSQLHGLGRALVGAITGARARDSLIDPRIALVLHTIRTHTRQIPLRELAAMARLSPDRLTHLFSQQVGMSIKRFALWAKVRRTVAHLGTSQPLTEAALTGGFADAAHMSRTFQQQFGLQPSFLAGQVRVTV